MPLSLARNLYLYTSTSYAQLLRSRKRLQAPLLGPPLFQRFENLGGAVRVVGIEGAEILVWNPDDWYVSWMIRVLMSRLG